MYIYILTYYVYNMFNRLWYMDHPKNCLNIELLYNIYIYITWKSKRQTRYIYNISIFKELWGIHTTAPRCRNPKIQGDLSSDGFDLGVKINWPGVTPKSEIHTTKKQSRNAGFCTKWAPTSYKWSYNPDKWPYTWVTGVITPKHFVGGGPYFSDTDGYLSLGLTRDSL